MNPSCVKFILSYLVFPPTCICSIGHVWTEQATTFVFNDFWSKSQKSLEPLNGFILKTFEQHSFTFLFGTFM